MKVLLARGASSAGDPRFFEAGPAEMGTLGISFPSGHAAEAVLIYGRAVHLIAHYSGAPQHLARNLRWIVVLICVNSVSVYFILGWHWMTDLIGGLLAGGLFLRLLVEWDRRAGIRAGREAFTGAASLGAHCELLADRRFTREHVQEQGGQIVAGDRPAQPSRR